jgi:hypothetical protein
LFPIVDARVAGISFTDLEELAMRKSLNLTTLKQNLLRAELGKPHDHRGNVYKNIGIGAVRFYA